MKRKTIVSRAAVRKAVNSVMNSNTITRDAEEGLFIKKTAAKKSTKQS